MNIHSILDFVTLTNKFRDVERLIYAAGKDRNENDAEHSYQLAMLAWYLLSTKEYDLNKDLVIKYALVHDFVEIYAGDIWFYRSEAKDDDKKKREAESAERLKKELPEFSELHGLIDDYEKRLDRESRFVYALDKLVPIFNLYLDGGRSWKEKKITLERLIEGKTAKIAISPEIEPYYKEMLAILEENKHMFHEEHQ